MDGNVIRESFFFWEQALINSFKTPFFSFQINFFKRFSLHKEITRALRFAEVFER